MKREREDALRNLRIVIEDSIWRLRSIETCQGVAHEQIANELEWALVEFRDTVSGNLWAAVFKDRGRVHITQLTDSKIKLVADEGRPCDAPLNETQTNLK